MRAQLSRERQATRPLRTLSVVVRRKLDAHDRAQLVMIAYETRLVAPS